MFVLNSFLCENNSQYLIAEAAAAKKAAAEEAAAARKAAADEAAAKKAAEADAKKAAAGKSSRETALSTHFHDAQYT